MNNEDWIIDAGDLIIEKRSSGNKLQDIESLVYCFWVLDYSMRNAGDLKAAWDLYPAFLSEGRTLSVKLSLVASSSLFALQEIEIEQNYFQEFDEICDEMKGFLSQGTA